jgi:hypothetical protein
MPLVVNSSTAGWTVGEYGIQGIPQALYEEPYYRGQSNYAGGCLWNEGYDSPPYWSFNSGGEYQLLSGPMLVAGGASIGSSYQTTSAPVAGSGAPRLRALRRRAVSGAHRQVSFGRIHAGGRRSPHGTQRGSLTTQRTRRFRRMRRSSSHGAL